jgi:signal transduction histidine kinase
LWDNVGADITEESDVRDTPTLALALAGLLLALAINVLVLPTTNLVASLYAVPMLLAAIRLRLRAVAIVSLLAILSFVASAQIQRWPVAQQVLAFPALLAIASLAILLSRQRGQTVERAREAEEALHLRDRFLSIAAHELRTPLTILKGSVQLLGTPVDGDRSARLARTIGRQVGRMEGLVEDMLDVSRIQAGSLRVEMRPFELRSAVEESIEEMALASSNAELCLEAGPGVWASGDRARIQQVVANLLRNAVQYSGASPRVRVQVWREGDLAVVEVADRGIGIPRKELPLVFEPHVRGANARGDRVGGLGLGLYISRGIAEAHGGEILVDSEEGSGSTFRLSLPAAPDASLV